MISVFGVGPKTETFARRPANDNHSVSGRMSALALAAGGNRMYAGSLAGLWRSDDAGENWAQLTWPDPEFGFFDVDLPGALYAPHIDDIATSPTDPDVVLVCARDSQFADGRDGVYRSADGGVTWTLVLKSASRPTSTPFNICFAPDDPQLVYAVGTLRQPGSISGLVAVSVNAGVTWQTQTVGSSLWHVAVAPLEPSGARRLYAVGDSVIWYSANGGATWAADAGVSTITTLRAQLTAFQQTCNPNAGTGGFGGAISGAVCDAATILAVEPGSPARVYLATGGGANGPTYYSSAVPDGTLVNTDCRRLAGEASLWVGDFTAFATTGAAQWSLLPGPPVYTGTTTPSGNRYVVTQPTSSGFLVFFSDNSHVHVSDGVPTGTASWHRLDGMDASEARRQGLSNTLFMHADPHAIIFTPDFEITLKAPQGVQDPYTRNSELDEHVAGRLWMANDGGVYWCDDGGKAEASWQVPHGIETLDPVNIAGLFGHGAAPALYFGCGDNNDFFSRDGGASWGDPGSGCGDCDAWFADIARDDWVLQFLPRRRDGDIGIISSGASEYPDASDGNSKTFVPSPKIINFNDSTKLSPCASSGVYLAGYRPLVRTIATEAPPPDGDVVIVEQALDGTAGVLRTTRIRSIGSLDDWHDTSKAQQVGPTMPPGAVVVQASGGHANPVMFVANRFGTVWRLNAAQTSWDQIVPRNPTGSVPVGLALSWFVDPYDPDIIYVLDLQGVKLSIDGGVSWFLDVDLTTAVTGAGKLTISASLLQDMVFSPGERQTVFAMGTAGVACTDNFGVTWFPVLNSVARPGRPESGFFDPLSNQSDRAVYVECEGRGVLRVGGLPALPPFQPQQPIDLMTFAALEY